MHPKLRKIFNKVKKGINLVEIVVAIGISSIALTTSAIFSTRLLYRSQENFMADSSTQLQSLIAEQLKLIEADMVDARQRYSAGTTTAYPLPFGSTAAWKDRFCGITTSSLHYTITLPLVTNSSQIINLTLRELQQSEYDANKASIEAGNEFGFTPLKPTELTGAFAQLSAQNNQIFVGLRKRELPSGIAGIPNIILFEIVIKYFVLDKTIPDFSNITEVKMVKNLVCP